MAYSSSHVWMWELDGEESWALKNRCFWSVVLEKTLESPLDCKEIQPVHPKGDQSWVFIGRRMLKLKLQYFGHLMQRVDSFEKTLMLGRIEGRRRRGQQRMRWLDGITNSTDMAFGWTLGVGDGQGGLACCSSWGHKVGHDWATELNWTEPTKNEYQYVDNLIIVHFITWSFCDASLIVYITYDGRWGIKQNF